MKLKPIIASYKSGHKIRQFLTDEVLEVIATIALSPQPVDSIDQSILAELLEMHVLRTCDNKAFLDTAVFLEKDIKLIIAYLQPLADDLAEQIKQQGKPFSHASPQTRLFLAGLLGIVQGMGRHMTNFSPDAAAWKSHQGRYEKSKVDFDEICDVYHALKPDYLNKTILVGDRYVAVFIGSGGLTYESLLYPTETQQKSAYRHYLNQYLVDEFAELLLGKPKNNHLHAAAESARLISESTLNATVITPEITAQYQHPVEFITEIVTSFFAEKQPGLNTLLNNTTAGKQGVTPANMSMHLWRYVRRLTADALYCNGFFTDDVPQTGCATVFYEKNDAFIRRLLC
jgi:hypothetical protein